MELHRFFRYAIEKMCKEKKSLNHFDMYHHLSNLRQHLKEGADLNYILGNSSFYGNYVDTNEIIKEMLSKLGYSEANSIIIRKRNSRSHLYEYLISAVWKTK